MERDAKRGRLIGCLGNPLLPPCFCANAGYVYENQTSLPGDLSDVVQLAAREEHTCALKRSGTVACWGALPPSWPSART